MTSTPLSSSTSYFQLWQKSSTTSNTTTITFSSINNPSLFPVSSSSSSSSSSRTTISKRFAIVCKISDRDNNSPSTAKAISVSQPIKSKQVFGIQLMFRRRSLWRRIFFASKKVRAILLLNVITIIYASDIPILKEVEEFMDPATFNVVRFTISAIPFLPAAFRARDDAQTCMAGAELGFWASLGYLLQAFGLLTSDASRASFISMLTVIVVPLLNGMLGAVTPPLIWFGAILSVVGVGMLQSSGSPPDVGDLLNFLSAIFFGVHMLRTEKISRTTRKENYIPLLGYEVCVVALLSMMWFFIEGWLGESHRPWTWDLFSASFVSFPWIPAIYTGIFSTICLWVEMAAMRDVSATETAIIYALEPIWGAGFAWFLLGERWDTTGWIGATFILSGSLIVQMFGSLSSTDSGDWDQ